MVGAERGIYEMKITNDKARKNEAYRRLREEELQSHQNVQGGVPLIHCNTDHLQAADDFAGRALSSLRPFADEKERASDAYYPVRGPIVVELIQKQLLSPGLTRFGLSPESDAIMVAARGIDDIGKINQFIALRQEMEPGQYMFEQHELVGKILHAAVSETDSIKEDRRIRNQRCSRRLRTVSQVVESRKFGPRFFGFLKMRLYLNPNRQHKDDISALISFRAKFLKDWKKRSDFEGVTDYFWFLVPDWNLGATLNFYFIIDIEFNPNISALADRLGAYWCNEVTKGTGGFTQDAYFINQVGVFPNNACIVDTANPNAMNKVMGDLFFECERELYIRFKRADAKECFGHGSVGNCHWVLHRQRENVVNSAKVPVSDGALMARFLPFIESPEHLESLGVYMGFDYSTSSSIYHRPAALQNSHVAVFGPTGSGKTTGLLFYCKGLIREGVPFLVLDPHNQALGRLPIETCIVSNGTGASGVNPLRLYFSEWKKRGLDGQIDDKIDLIDQGAGNSLGHRERDVLKTALRELYERSGLRDEPPNEKWICPTMVGLVNVLEEYLESADWKDQKKSIAGALAAIRSRFGNRVFNQDSFVDAKDFIDGNGLRLDLSGLEEKEIGMVMNAILRDVWQRCRGMGPLPIPAKSDAERFRLFVIIDEAHLLNMGASPNAKGGILDALMRGGRKFGVCIVIATQGVDDMSDVVRKNSATWVVFRQTDEVEARVIARKFGVSSDALRSLKNASEAFFWDGRRPKASCIELSYQDDEDHSDDSKKSPGNAYSYYDPDDITT